MGARRRLPGVRALVRRQRRRRHRRPRGDPRQLDHIASLGVDAIWLTPCYPSPQRDHGYDVADYFDIDPDYGDLADASTRSSPTPATHGLRVLLDMVPNHCSDRAPVVPGRAGRRARAATSGPASASVTAGDGGSEPPNNWQAAFGGSAWTRRRRRRPAVVPRHVHAAPARLRPHATPPSTRCSPTSLRFWFDRGVDGFRVDAIRPVGKDPALPDCPPLGARATFNPATRFRARGPRRVAAVAHGDRRVHRRPPRARPDDDRRGVRAAAARHRWPSTPGPTSSTSASPSTCCCRRGTRRRCAGRSARRSSTSAAQGAWPTLTLNNHDTQRIVTRLGHAEARRDADGVDRREPAARRRPRRPRARHPPRARRRRAAAGDARRRVPLPGRGARPAGGGSTCPTTPARTPCSPTPAAPRRAATAAGSRCRGRPTRRRRTASRRRRRRGGAVAAATGRLGPLRRRRARTATPASMLELYRRLIAARRALPHGRRRRARRRRTTTSSPCGAGPVARGRATPAAEPVDVAAAAGLRPVAHDRRVAAADGDGRARRHHGLVRA